MKNIILIADSGSTKTEWGVLSETGSEIITTQGISPYFLNTDQIRELLKQELIPFITHHDKITDVHYYGTGCTADGTVSVVQNALASLFPAAAIHVTYDLIAAAHALCGRNKGIACILGTGSNSCYWNGEAVEKNNPGLGYILGDEGSGAYLGKLLIAEYLYGKLDKDLEKQFEEKFEVDKDTLLTRVYSTSLPNRFLASFSVFYSQHRGNTTLEKLLKAGLDAFFKIHILSYPQSLEIPVHFTGSIAWAYQDVLLELCASYGLQPGKILMKPMQELVDYYRQQAS
jgi:glucosamine kinase